jgi:FkbM family methyltransferase
VKQIVRRLLSTRVRPHRILGGPLRGSRIVTSWRDYPAAIAGITERELVAWFREHAKPGETWLDVGAHYGYTAIALAQTVGPAGRVFAFEPVISTAGCVAQTRRLNDLKQLTVVPCGLGAPDRLTYLKLPIERGMADQTLRSQEERWWESIQIARLDWLWPLLNEGSDAIAGVKIDVQGMEIEVLRGMEAILRRQHPKLVIELHAGVDRSVVLDLLEGMGYRTSAHPIAPQPEPGDVLKDDHSYAFVANAMNSDAEQPRALVSEPV